MSTGQPDCIFCKISTGEIKAEFHLENDLLVAFDDIHPGAETHILLVPKKHILGFEAITAEDQDILSAITQAAQELIIQKNLGGQFKLVVNGPNIRHVDHLHFHLLGGKINKLLP